MLGGSQERKRLVWVTGRKCFVAQIPNRHLRNLADEHLIFNDQYYGHRNSFCRDNNIAAIRGPPAKTAATRARRVTPTANQGSVWLASLFAQVARLENCSCMQ